MRRIVMRRIVLVAMAVAVLGSAPAARAEDDSEVGKYFSRAGWKLFRGITNVVSGVPAEMVTHMGGGVSGPHATTIGSTVTGLCTGTVTGLALGLVRVGSGMVDMATFPLPFIPLEDNRPLIEPEFKL